MSIQEVTSNFPFFSQTDEDEKQENRNETIGEISSSTQGLFETIVHSTTAAMSSDERVTKYYAIIFGTGEQCLLIGLYILILVLGLVFNAAIVWVIVARSGNRSPRHMYIVNLASSGIVMAMVCVPPTLLQILYGGWWHLGVFACKLVPAIQGANILVSAFTIVVIAVDRWRSVVSTNPRDNNLSYRRVVVVICVVWMCAFAVTSPLLAFQDVERASFPNTEIVFFQACVERFPHVGYKTAFTILILVVQYLLPLIVLPVVHAKILIFLRKNSGFANDARRKEREMKRNRKMMMVLSGISVSFAISWLPLHLFLILTDIFTLFQNDQKTYFLVLGLCHAVAMSSSFTNPVMYGWCNTSLRSELETLLPPGCRSKCLQRQVNGFGSVKRRLTNCRRQENSDKGEECEERSLNKKVKKTTKKADIHLSNCDLNTVNETAIITVERKLVPRREQHAECGHAQVKVVVENKGLHPPTIERVIQSKDCATNVPQVREQASQSPASSVCIVVRDGTDHEESESANCNSCHMDQEDR